jgi:DNA N-6-adenine-methyltransferase Dam
MASRCQALKQALPPMLTQPTTQKDRPYIPQAKNADWRTPPEIISLVHDVFEEGIDLDPCAGPHSIIARRNIRPTEDGLAVAWNGNVFVNPPFSENKHWVPKCHREAASGANIILLVPARTDTNYWHEYIAPSATVCFWRGRIKFVGAKHSAPFPVAFCYWGDRPGRFIEVFSPEGFIHEPPFWY